MRKTSLFVLAAGLTAMLCACGSEEVKETPVPSEHIESEEASAGQPFRRMRSRPAI